MKVYESKNIRNIALVGHAGSGKTSLTECILFKAGMINRIGKVEDNNTVSDFRELEHEKGNSVYGTPVFAEWKDTKINLIDNPGFDDYIGEVNASIYAADVALITINAAHGAEVGSDFAWQYANELEKPTAFVINKLDAENIDFDTIISELQERYSKSIKPTQFPVTTGPSFNAVIDVFAKKMLTIKDGNVTESEIPDEHKDKADELYSELLESVAETDEELMNKYLEEGQISEDEFKTGLKKAITNRLIMPIFAVSSKNNIGMVTMLNFIVNNFPSPVDMPNTVSTEGKEVAYDEKAKTSLFMYKLYSDPRLGDMTYFKVMSGTLKSSMDMNNTTRNQSERFGQLFVIQGKDRTEVAEVHAGDLAATVKLKTAHVNDTFAEKGLDVTYKKIVYPRPKVRVAIYPKTKGEEEKVGMGLHSLNAEDPSYRVEHSQELRQTILHAQGELHLQKAKYRLEKRYKVEAEFGEPRVPYRETIQKSINSDYRHKKQSGGAGQFAEVHMRIEPWAENAPYASDLTVRGKELHDLKWGGKLEFVNCIVGGVIDQRFMPAILKGIMDKMEIGPLTGSYVRDIRVYVHDGKMHPVDSNEAAFKMAGSQAFKSGFVNANPKILEPIYNVAIKVPEDYVGDIMSDLPSRRGMILGIDTEGRFQVVNAKMPQAELDKYATAIRSMTQAKGTFSAEFDEYQPVPGDVQSALIDKYKKDQEDDE
jgi:elongation factor G